MIWLLLLVAAAAGYVALLVASIALASPRLFGVTLVLAGLALCLPEIPFRLWRCLFVDERTRPWPVGSSSLVAGGVMLVIFGENGSGGLD